MITYYHIKYPKGFTLQLIVPKGSTKDQTLKRVFLKKKVYLFATEEFKGYSKGVGIIVSNQFFYVSMESMSADRG